MKNSHLLAVIAGTVLALTGTMVAQAPAAKSSQKSDKKVKAATTSLRGAVKSISDSELVVEQKNKELKFVINAETQKQGDIKAGSEVTVEYRFEDMKDVATRIQALPAKGKKGL